MKPGAPSYRSKPHISTAHGKSYSWYAFNEVALSLNNSKEVSSAVLLNVPFPTRSRWLCAHLGFPLYDMI